MSQRDGGKGDTQRPLGVPMDKFDSQWDLIFGKKRCDECKCLIVEGVCGCWESFEKAQQEKTK